MEHCFGGEETHETTGRRKHQGGSSALLRIGKKIHEGKIYLKQLLLMDRFAVKRYGKGTKQFTKQENNLKGWNLIRTLILSWGHYTVEILRNSWKGR